MKNKQKEWHTATKPLNFPPVLLTLMTNLPPVSTRPAVSVEKFTAGVLVVHLDLPISLQIF